MDDLVSPILLDRQQKRRADGHQVLPSQDLLDRTIQFQLEQIQGTGCRLPSEMQDRLADMIQHASSRPADVHFIKYASSLYISMMSDSFVASSTPGARGHTPRPLTICIDTSTMRWRVTGHIKRSRRTTSMPCSILQYSMPTLAHTKRPYRLWTNALLPVRDILMHLIMLLKVIARENQDSRCLNFGLSWLLHLRRAHPEYIKHERLLHSTAFAGSDSDILFFLQQKALESKDWTQLSSTLLSQAESVVQSVSHFIHIVSTLFLRISRDRVLQKHWTIRISRIISTQNMLYTGYNPHKYGSMDRCSVRLVSRPSQVDPFD